MTAQPSSQAEREDVALLPCPFDGRPAYYVQIDGVRWAARCAYCHVTRGGNLEKADAALSWNTRPDREHATPRSMPEEVVEAIWKRACEGREGYCSSDLQDAARWAIGEAFRLAEQAARSATLPAGYQWSDGNREKFDFGRDTAADAIRAIPGASA